MDTLGAMVGRQTPILAVVVPLVLVFVVDGRRGVRQTWLPAIVCGLSFGVAQFVAANYISVPLADIVAALVSAAAVVLLLRVWSPSEVLAAESSDSRAPASSKVTAGSGGGAGTDADGDVPARDGSGEVWRAYAPYAVIIALFSIANITAVKEWLAEEPWTYAFQWPGLEVLNPDGEPVKTLFTFNWLPAAGTLMIIAGIITAIILKVSAADAVRAYGRTYVELKSAIITVMAVLALAYVMNLSGQTTSLGAWLAGAGGAFAILSPILGWIGVAVTGSDTSANALFGALQVQTAKEAGLDPVLMAAANSSGGVLGKMVSPQNLAIAAAAVGMAGREGDIFRKVIGWSLVGLLLMCVIVGLQSTPVLGWMVP